MSKVKPASRIDRLELQVGNLSTKVDMFIDEMREQNRQRAAEIAAMDKKIAKMQEQTDAKISKIQEQTDAKFSKIEEKLEDMGKHVRNMAITAMVGLIAISVAVVGLVYSIITR